MPKGLAEDLVGGKQIVRQVLSKVRPHTALDVKQSTGEKLGGGIMWIWEIMG